MDVYGCVDAVVSAFRSAAETLMVVQGRIQERGDVSDKELYGIELLHESLEDVRE